MYGAEKTDVIYIYNLAEMKATVSELTDVKQQLTCRNEESHFTADL